MLSRIIGTQWPSTTRFRTLHGRIVRIEAQTSGTTARSDAEWCNRRIAKIPISTGMSTGVIRKLNPQAKPHPSADLFTELAAKVADVIQTSAASAAAASAA